MTAPMTDRFSKVHDVPCQDRHFQAVPAFYTNFEVARIEVSEQLKQRE